MRVARAAPFLSLLMIGSLEGATLDDQLKQKVLRNEPFNNDDITELCKGADRVDTKLGALVAGLPVRIRLNATSFSPSKGSLSGEFQGRSGAFAETIYVDSVISGVSIPKNLNEGSTVVLDGRLTAHNEFYGNAVEGCVISLQAHWISVDGF